MMDENTEELIVAESITEVIPTELNDGQLLHMIGICDQYAKQQKLLSEKLSSGILQLLQARKNTLVSMDAIRENFDPCLHLEKNSENGDIDLIDDGNTIDALLMFSALPPPSLRRAQKLFSESIRITLQLVSTINEIDLETH
jgi:hypothetical protein